ncbi:MAG: hypothetical protein C0504_00570 [Candidatus Solibacter sp.]|nr:hypothetical protein [Candidatus Solibacter sp.]
MRVSNWMHGILAVAVLALSPSLFAAEDPSPQHVQWMKEQGELSGKIRKGVDIEASAKRMAAVYKEVEGFWAKRSAVGASTTKEGQTASLALAKAAAEGDQQAIAAASKQLGGTCRTCHDAHREKISDTEYKIR